MSAPLTQADVDEIVAYMNANDPEHKRLHIRSDEDGWSVVVTGENGFFAVVHPKSFLDLIREENL